MNQLRYSEGVRDAIDQRAPVVALETTILSHGMPYPHNLRAAREIEHVVRAAGAVPATIGVIGGEICIGLSDAQLEHFAQSGDVLKLSRADVPYALAARRDGATTVAATMLCAHLAGITVFATGGIGGVHRGAERTMDVSADLHELARTPVLVVCAGAKAILDIPKTLELLETLGVPVAAYCTDDFPAFWSRSSGIRAPRRIDDAATAAAMFAIARGTGLSSGMLLANPVPADAQIEYSQMQPIVERAVDEANSAGISGKALTPWLLERIYQLTQGASLQANIALVRSNAQLAAEIAAHLA
jgi:pseudouridylate synthase